MSLGKGRGGWGRAGVEVGVGARQVLGWGEGVFLITGPRK